jgi:hypothetical protein
MRPRPLRAGLTPELPGGFRIARQLREQVMEHGPGLAPVLAPKRSTGLTVSVKLTPERRVYGLNLAQQSAVSLMTPVGWTSVRQESAPGALYAGLRGHCMRGCRGIRGDRSLLGGLGVLLQLSWRRRLRNACLQGGIDDRFRCRQHGFLDGMAEGGVGGRIDGRAPDRDVLRPSGVAPGRASSAAWASSAPPSHRTMPLPNRTRMTIS